MFREVNDGKISSETFTYKVKKDKKVLIFWYDKMIKILSGTKAEKFISAIVDMDSLEAQQLMAKITGNLKRKKDENADTIIIRGAHFTRSNKHKSK